MSAVDGLRADIVWEANTGQAIADLGAVGEEYARTTGAMSDQALRLAAAQDRLTASIARSGPESRAAKTATLAYRQELAALTAEANTASNAVTRNAEAQARAAAAATDTALKNQLAAARTVGRTLTTYVTAPTVILGAVAVKMGLDYEDALRLIQTQAGATAAEVDSASDSILRLVRSGDSFGQTANDMAKGLFAIESEGVRGAKALQILKVAAAGAAVGQTDLAQTANALTSVMRVYELDANQAAGAMATLNASVGAGKLHMEDLNAALATKFLPTAKQLGITLPQALAALDVFTKAGIPAEVAANNLTTSFIKFEAPTKAAGASLLQLGLGTKQLAEDLQKGGLPVALQDLVRGYDALERSQGKVAANQAIFGAFGGARGGAPILALVQQYQSYLKGLDQVQKQSNPATFWNLVARTMQLPSQRIREDIAKITASLVHLGTTLAPLVADIVHGADEILGAFGKLPGPIKNDIGAIVGLAAILGPALIVIASVGRAVRAIGTGFREVPAVAGPAIAETDAQLATLEASTAAAAGEVVGLEAAFRALPEAAGPALATTDAGLVVLQSSLAATTAETEGLGAALGGLSLRGLAGGIGRAGLYAGGGLLAGQLAGSVIPGEAGKGIGGALEGAGIGAGIGSFIGPEGTAAGAAVGALAGAMLTLIHEGPSFSQQLQQAGHAVQTFGTQASSARDAVLTLQQQLAQGRVNRDQAEQELKAAQEQEKATRGTRQHAAAVDRLRLAQVNLHAVNAGIKKTTDDIGQAHQAAAAAARHEAAAITDLTEKLQGVAAESRVATVPMVRLATGSGVVADKSKLATEKLQNFSDKMRDLARSVQSSDPKLAAAARLLVRIAQDVHKIPSKKTIDIVVRTILESPTTKAGELARAQAEDAYYGLGKSGSSTHHGHHGRHPRFTVNIPIDLQIQFAQAQYDNDVKAERAALEAEKRFLEHELRLAKTKKQRLAALQALQAVQDQIDSLRSSAAASRSSRARARYASREDRLEATVENAQAAEQAARTVKQERAAYERERHARQQLLALYEREAHDRNLTARQRAAARKKAAAERKALAKLEDDSRQQELEIAVLQAENAAAAAVVGSKAYDKAIAAEKKALEREIAYDKARANNAKLSQAERKKALEEELAAQKKLAQIEKQHKQDVQANERQFLSEFAAITGSFGSNATPVGPHTGRMATHLYELVHDQRSQTAVLKEIAAASRFGGSDAALEAGLAVS